MLTNYTAEKKEVYLVEAETTDSQIESVLSKLSKKTRKWVHLAQEEHMQRLPAPSRGLNMAMGGGFGHGRITTLWGNKSAGKSSLSLAAIGIAQRSGLTCAYLDAERTFDPDWAESSGCG
jgi:recombination protein RecA